ncbi:uncharacterized protein ISCGN_021141 [Ixodes scapularis]
MAKLPGLAVVFGLVIVATKARAEVRITSLAECRKTITKFLKCVDTESGWGPNMGGQSPSKTMIRRIEKMNKRHPRFATKTKGCLYRDLTQRDLNVVCTTGRGLKNIGICYSKAYLRFKVMGDREPFDWKGKTNTSKGILYLRRMRRLLERVEGILYLRRMRRLLERVEACVMNDWEIEAMVMRQPGGQRAHERDGGWNYDRKEATGVPVVAAPTQDS